MSILYSLKITTMAILQIFILGLFGYILTKKKIATVDNLKFLSELVIKFLLPCFIFTELIENFSFRAYPNWWIFPLLSFFVTLVGFITGLLFTKIDRGLEKFKKEFISLVTFQNGGYLPLILVAFLLPAGRCNQMFIYIFLFLLGFNLVVWSLGLSYLIRKKDRKFELRSLLNPPVIAIASALFLIAVGIDKVIPRFLIEPTRMLGSCVLPLAILVVGGNLARIDINPRNHFRHISYLIVAKLLFLPLVFLGLIFLIKPPYPIAFLLLIESAVPSATSLSLITRHYDREDNIVSLGVFWTHLICLLTLPIFLTLFSSLKVLIYG